MVLCLCCCLPGEEGGERPALIETQSAVEDELPTQVQAVELEPTGCRDSVPGSCFTVGVDTDLRGAPPLGLTFDVMDPAVCVVASVSAPSLIHSWNQRCAPEEVVKPRDRLVKVNGLSRADAEGLAKVLAEGLGHKKKAHALLEFQHPLVVDVKLRKDGALPLGLSLHYALSENKIGGLCVKSIGDGLVKAKGLQIKEGHRVVAIDASEMGVDKMLETLRVSKEVTLTIISWPEQGGEPAAPAPCVSP